MSLSLYDVSITPYLRALTNLHAILQKAETHASENSIPLSKYINARLAPDMKPFIYQIQASSDTAKGLAARLNGTEPIKMPDTETTFDELKERIQKTIEVLKSVKKSDFDGKEGKEIVVSNGKIGWRFNGLDYVNEFAGPNFWFHVGMAYAILRMEGVPVGKMDFLGQDVMGRKVEG